jgi:hypothetical protein
LRKVFKHLWSKYSREYREYGNLGLYSVSKIVSDYAQSIQTYSENTQKESMRA